MAKDEGLTVGLGMLGALGLVGLAGAAMKNPEGAGRFIDGIAASLEEEHAAGLERETNRERRREIRRLEDRVEDADTFRYYTPPWIDEARENLDKARAASNEDEYDLAIVRVRRLLTINT